MCSRDTACQVPRLLDPARARCSVSDLPSWPRPGLRDGALACGAERAAKQWTPLRAS